MVILEPNFYVTGPTLIYSVCPLAKYDISLAQNLEEEAERLRAEAEANGLDTTAAEEIMTQADEYLEKAQQFCFEGSNCIAGNWNALKAAELYQQAIDILKNLLKK